LDPAIRFLNTSTTPLSQTNLMVIDNGEEVIFEQADPGVNMVGSLKNL
jgi:hypothetical protein